MSKRNAKVKRKPASKLAVAAASASAQDRGISDEALAFAKRKRGSAVAYEPFKPYVPLPGVVGDARIAMDESWGGTESWAQQGINGVYGGEGFLGYPELSLLAQKPEYRKIMETISLEMTREWIELYTVGEDEADEKADKIRAINTEMDRLEVKNVFKTLAEQDGYFGRAHLYLDTGDTEDRDELTKPIGDGRNQISQGKVGPRKKLQALRPVEAVWCYPLNYDSNNPLKSNWYKPDIWYVQGTPVHVSRILPFIGRPVPDLLKPAYSFGGLSLSQMAKPYVNNWLETRTSVAQIIRAFTVFVVKTNMTQVLKGNAGDSLWKRLNLFNETRDNSGVLALDKDTEDFNNVSAPLGGLDALQAQTQEHMASVSGIPLVKLLGIQPAGLNASSEGELDCFETLIHGYQESLFRPHLDTVFGLIQLSLFGEVDPDIKYKFRPLGVLDEKEKAELRKIEAETDQILVDGGVIDPSEARKRIVADKDSPYDSLDPDDMPDLQEEEQEGLPVKPGGANGGGGVGGFGSPASATKPAGDEQRSFFGASDEDQLEESKHPRKDNGQFGKGPGGAKAPLSDKKKASLAAAHAAMQSPTSFQAAMKKIPKKASEKQAVFLAMQKMLGVADPVSGPQAYATAMKALASKKLAEKQAFTKQLHQYLNGDPAHTQSSSKT
jgi:phage-related protein (TIGR01555 family)